MADIDLNKLRDPTFKRRYANKQAEIKAVHQAHRYLTYQTNRHLFDELQAIYEENLSAYQQYYETPLRRYHTLKQQLPEFATQMHPLRMRTIDRLLGQIEALLAKEDYAENAKALPLFDEIQTHLDKAREEYAGWETDLAEWRQELKTLMGEVWAEDYQPLKAAYQQAKLAFRGNRLPPLPLQADAGTVASARAERAQAMKRLQRRLRWHPQLKRALGEVMDKYLSKADFATLSKQLIRQRNRRLYVRLGILGLILSLSGLGLAFGPAYFQQRQEQQAWEEAKAEHSLEAYARYLDEWPQGEYRDSAMQARWLMPSGRLDSLTNSAGLTFLYEGELDSLIPHGQGQAWYRDSARYRGQWMQGLREGKGTFWLADSSEGYEGQWKSDLRHGWGLAFFRDGSRYRGNWQADQFHGSGTLILADSSQFQGHWVAGKRQGKGRLRLPDASTVAATWKADEIVGKVQQHWPDGRHYAGDWQNGQKHGSGTLTYPDQRRYVGQWQHDRMQGRGTFRWPEGGAFNGRWRNDSIVGEGSFTSRDGQSFQGHWKGTLQDLTRSYFDVLGNVLKQRGRLEEGKFILHESP